MRILYPRPALIVIARPHRHHPPSSSSPALVVTARHRRHTRPRHRCSCCRHLPSSSRLPSSSPPTLIVAACALHPCSLLLPARTHCCCQRIALILVEARTHCSRRALVAPAIVIAACSRCHPHLLPSLLLPLIGCLD